MNSLDNTGSTAWSDPWSTTIQPNETSTNHPTNNQQSPGRISVSTVELWRSYQDRLDSRETPASYSDQVPSQQPLPTTPQATTAPGAGQRFANESLSLLAIADIRLRSRYPVQVTCPHCTATIVTMIAEKRGLGAYLGACLFSICCLCCIPLYVPAFQDVQHFCPHCSQLIGVCPAV